MFQISWVTSGYFPAHSNPPSIRKDYISYYILSSFSFINIGKSITYQSCILCPRLTHSSFFIHDFSECVTGIFSLVKGDDLIRNSYLLDTCQQQDGLILNRSSIFLYFWINISQISQISTIRTKTQALYIKQYVTTCFQIQSRIILSLFLG